MRISKIHLSDTFKGAVILLGGALLLLLFVTSSTSYEDDVKKGLVTYTDGRVKKRPVDEQDWINAAKDTTVLKGDRVRTYQRSRAELELMELDVIRMAPETIIDVVKLYDETKQKLKETQINLEQGDIWANIKKKDKNTKFGISAPVAVAAITGTVLRLGVAADSTTELRVYNGEVRITNAPEKKNLTPRKIEVHEVPGPHQVPGPREVSMEEWIYIVKNMQKIIIDNKGQVKEVGDFKKTDKDEQSLWVKWNIERDKME